MTTTSSEPFFSWTSRRIDLSAAADARTVAPELDESLRCGSRKARLLAIRDSESETDYVALLVGDVSGHSDVTVREVDEERLLVEGSRPSTEPEILLGITPEPGYSGPHHVDREVFVDGPVRSLIIRSGARSVVVDLCHEEHTRSAPREQLLSPAPPARTGPGTIRFRVAQLFPSPRVIRWWQRLLPHPEPVGPRRTPAVCG
ncbi:hypothetical protein [Rhodococcus rhodochrous]|uniref:hypothetical protein n=1 Tax=Rhodococcus rhodochrous TaxID=1829 RepID=UPI001E629490|nr:hypothetical protein [Rhodococcus rhodochrous]MCD2099381.1 hypothetical protein [Rhodococcus rhodochrous]MCD2123750.1 hypothetical protein [Rhodococcus rhodochrous]MCQ4136357.1 hypothetical protein [Rhodococcus rhodochrous]MDJ0020647.1 hypothetical protein [Rhodococcus rhodochrous]